MTMIFRHAVLSLRAVLTEPARLAMLAVCAVAALLYWPGLTDSSGSGWPGFGVNESQSALLSSLIALMWLVFWPTLATGAVRGGAAGARRDPSYALRPHPALPLTARARSVSEALVVLAAAFVVRVPASFVGELPAALAGSSGGMTPAAPWSLAQTVAGGLVMLPILLMSGVASRSIERYWLRSWAVVGVVIAAMLLGLFQTLASSALTSAALSAGALLLMGRLSTLRLRPRPLRAYLQRRGFVLSRPARPPESQFRRDLWTRSLPAAAALLVAEGVALLADQTIGLPPFGFFVVSVIVFSWLLAMVTFKPMGSKLAVAGLFGKPGFEPGDFGAVWGVLPLRRRIVAHDLYVYGLVTAGAIWAAAAGTILLSSWLETGRAAFVDATGDPLEPILLPTLAMIPAVAAFLTCAAHGDKRGAYMSGAILVATPPFAALMLVQSASNLTRLGVALVLAVASTVPALKHLRDRHG